MCEPPDWGFADPAVRAPSVPAASAAVPPPEAAALRQRSLPVAAAHDVPPVPHAAARRVDRRLVVRGAAREVGEVAEVAEPAVARAGPAPHLEARRGVGALPPSMLRLPVSCLDGGPDGRMRRPARGLRRCRSDLVVGLEEPWAL